VTAVNLADPGSPDYVPCYGSEPLKTESLGELSLRGGNANGDRYVNATGDFALWLLANGSVPGAGNWDARADFNGNLAINSADFSVWLAQNGRVSYVLPAAAAAAAANGTRSGELRLRFRDAADGRLEADVVVTLPAQRRLIAVDAAVTYDLTSLSQPELVADHVAAGMTDFSLGSAAPDLTGAYHYSRGALPGQSGALLPAGETALYTLRFQRLDPSSDAAPRIAFASGFADIVTQPAPGRLPARVRAATE